MNVQKAKPKVKFKIPQKQHTVVALGFDISLASIAGAAKMKDGTLRKLKGPKLFRHDWTREATHLTKLMYLSKAHEFVYILLHDLNAVVDLPYIYIGVEDVPPRVMSAQRYREQCELLGAFLGGLARYGLTNIELVNVRSWQAMVAADLDVKANKDFDKWTVKKWTRMVYPEVPKFPDLIRSGKKGLIPKPKGSTAMPEQPDDRYDAIGIMEWTWSKIPQGVLNV